MLAVASRHPETGVEEQSWQPIYTAVKKTNKKLNTHFAKLKLQERNEGKATTPLARPPVVYQNKQTNKPPRPFPRLSLLSVFLIAFAGHSRRAGRVPFPEPQARNKSICAFVLGTTWFLIPSAVGPPRARSLSRVAFSFCQRRFGARRRRRLPRPSPGLSPGLRRRQSTHQVCLPSSSLNDARNRAPTQTLM